jgi:predicted O-linked N-acetylglucosamine transferase (SPINDLY family)
LDPTAALRAAQAYFAAAKFGEAASVLAKAAATHPKHAEVVHFYGMALARTPRRADAEPHLRRSVELDPENPKYLANLGNYLNFDGQFEDAVGFYRRAIAASPDHPRAWVGLTSCLHSLGETEEALAAGARAVEVSPTASDAYINLSFVEFELGDAEQAIRTIRAGLDACPNDPSLLVALGNAINYSDSESPESQFEAHRAIGASLAPADGPRIRAGSGDRSRIRVGFLSPDFRRHSVAHFALPAMQSLDPDEFELVLYSAGGGHDEYTERFRSAASKWRDVMTVPDPQLREQVASDRVDVLIELAGHTRHSRVRALSARCAPVQATWIGYPNTTGVPSVDVRFVDSITDPPGSEGLSTETLVRLDPCFLCYEPPDDAPTPRRSDRQGIVFGSFNNIAKITPSCIRLWCGALNAAGGSRLLLKGKGLQFERARERIISAFAEHGISSDRLEFRDQAASPVDHLAMYADVDVALDTFPYNGTTTTCEALWMGVPVITLAGGRHASRVSASLLAAAGKAEWVAHSEQAFGELAAQAASAPPDRLALRDEIRGSALMDAGRLSRSLSDAIRELLDAV